MNLYLVGKHPLSPNWRDNALDRPLFDRLAKSAERVVLIAQSVDDREGRWRLSNIYLILIPRCRCNTLRFALRALRWMMRMHRRIPASVVGASEPFGGGLAAFMFHFLISVPVLQMVQGNIMDLPAEHFSAAKRWLMAKITAGLCRRAQGVRAVSRRIKADLIQAGVESRKILVLANRVDLKRFSPDASRNQGQSLRVNWGWDRSRTVICFLGALTSEKGFEDFCVTAKTAMDQHDTVNTLILGDGPLRQAGERILAPYGDRVRFAGFVRHDQVHGYLAAADILLFCSHHEGMPRVVLEYLAMRKPVISTPVGGIGEVITDGDNGLLVPVGEPAAASTAISRILNDPAAAHAMALAGRQTVYVHHELERAVNSQVRMYRLLARRWPRNR